MTKRKTNEQYIQECKQKGYDLPIEPYINTHTKIKHKCSNGHIYEQSPDSHLHGHGCPICYGNKKITHKQYYNICKLNGYDLPIEKYVNMQTKVKHKCKKGHIYEQRPDHHLNGHGCKLCATNKAHDKQRKVLEDYIKECKLKGYDIPIEDYINSDTKIKHKCNKCGNIYEQRPYNHLNGQGCPKCAKDRKRKSAIQYIEECKSKGYDLPIDSYVDNRTKIKHKCSKGHVYLQRPDMHIGKAEQGCPICNESHGEKYIRNYLDSKGIKYIPQKKFHDLRDKTYLSYDFYLPDYNILIEYQGKQHYKAFDYFGGKDNLIKQQLHDNLKRTYAKEHDYKLLELHYSLDTQDKVNKYLKRRIKD